MSTTNQVLRQLPILTGLGLGLVLMANRLLFTPDLTVSQARADALGVLLSAMLVLTGLLWQQVQPRQPDAVQLVGEAGLVMHPDLPEALQRELAWMSHSLLTNTVTRSLVVWYQGRVLLRRGILGQSATVTPGPILQRVLDKQQPVYLVDLKVYPGRIEFDYLPENAQGVICQPIGSQGLLILAANAPRSYTRQDERWIAALAEKLADTCQRCLP